MRITNRIIQDNSVAHVNNIKILEDKLNTQLATGKEIVKPSDDPVIAIRALRLRTNCNETDQFYKKNVPDASSWMSVTEKAIDKVGDLLTEIYSQATKGTQSYEKAADLNSIVMQMRQYSDEIFHNGNADYAGRTVFTGYRTGINLTFDEDTNKKYQIEQNVSGVNCFDTYRYINYKKVDGVTHAIDENATEQDVTYTDVHRIRLAYKDLDQISAEDFNISFATGEIKTLNPETNIYSYESTYTNITEPPISAVKEVISLYDANNPYEYIAENDDAVVLVPETGEVLLGKDVYEKLQKMTEKNVDGTSWDESEILINFQKTNWLKGETRPEHYFKSKSEGVEYNYDIPAYKQLISYDVGLNQNIQVNTLATEVFDQGISRELDELEETLREFVKIEDYKNEMEKKFDEDETLKNQFDAIKKAYDLYKDKLKEMFSKCIGRYQGYMDKVNLAETNEGSRSARLKLVENRLSSQKDNFDELKSINEDANETEVAINLSSANLTYQAALMATSKVVSTTLLNYL